MKQKIELIYLSTSGNTRKVAGLIGEEISSWADVSIASIRAIKSDPGRMRNASVIGIGAPVFHLRLAEMVTDLIRKEFPPGAGSTTPSFFVFCTYAGISSGLSLFSLAKYLIKAGYPVLGALKVKAPHFYQTQVKFPEARQIEIIRNFVLTLRERVITLPEQGQLLHKLDYQRLLVKMLHIIIPLVSNHRVPRIEVSAADCRNCGACVKACPMGAIRIRDGSPYLNHRACMHCYHCAKICSSHALTFDESRLRQIVDFNKRVLGEEQPATAFY